MLTALTALFAVTSYAHAGTYLSIKAPADHPLVSFGNLLQTLLDGSSFAKVEVQTISPSDGHVVSVKSGPVVDDADFFESFDTENNSGLSKTPSAHNRSTQPVPRNNGTNGVLTAKTNSSEAVLQSVNSRLNEALALLKRQRTAVEHKLNETESQFLNYSEEKSVEDSSQITDQFDLAREHVSDLESDAKQLTPERTRQELDRFKSALHEWETNFRREMLQEHIRLRDEFSKATLHWRNTVLSENTRLQARIQRDNDNLLRELKRLQDQDACDMRIKKVESSLSQCRRHNETAVSQEAVCKKSLEMCKVCVESFHSGVNSSTKPGESSSRAGND